MCGSYLHTIYISNAYIYTYCLRSPYNIMHVFLKKKYIPIYAYIMCIYIYTNIYIVHMCIHISFKYFISPI